MTKLDGSLFTDPLAPVRHRSGRQRRSRIAPAGASPDPGTARAVICKAQTPAIPYTEITVICYIDAFSGLAGDMLVAALADAGADRDAITRALQSLATEGSFAWEQVKRRGMSAAKFRVAVAETPKHRHLSGILKVIAAADLPESVKTASGRVFQALGEAEASAHGVGIEKVHFHEVGAVDSICDIVGICMGLHLLNVDRIYCSAINVGSGTVNTEHGVLPVPAPATARLLEGKPIYSRGPALELTTPTGAAIVAALADGFGPMPAMSVRSIGYGAGDHDFMEHANIVRVMIGEASGAPESTTVSVIEANIDDASPQVIGWATERLLEAGALDAVVIPAQMKKNRPGVLLQVMAPPEKREELIALIFRETTTLGVRFYTAERRVQARDWVDVTTAHGVVRMKTGPNTFAPEYEDARRIAAATGLPLKQILAEAVYEYRKAEYLKTR
jgi:uncharacterized protein (TIGR00299 family) protein